MLLVLPLVNAGCQNSAAPASSSDIEISPATLKTADWAGFKYKEVLSKAKTGDMDAIGKFLEFHKVVDGSDALGHAVSTLELIPIVGDYQFALAIQKSKPTLRELLSNRLMIAQGRTKKVELQKPLAEWAPDVAAALKGEPLPNIPNTPAMQEGLKRAKDAAMYPPRPGSPADSTATQQAKQKLLVTPQATTPGAAPAPKPATPPATPAQPKPGQQPRQ